MSFGGRPPWHQHQTWRPYEGNQAPGPIRGNNNGWQTWNSDPYFARNVHAHNHMANYERNRMQMFTQNQPRRKTILENPGMTDYARQTLLNNIHVPGLRTGLQIRSTIQQRKISRDLVKKEHKEPVDALHVNVVVLSEKIELRWDHPKSETPMKYVITCENTTTKNSPIVRKEFTATQFCDLPVTAGQTYRISLSCQDPHPVATWQKSIRAEFSYAELNKLLEKCLEFVRAPPQMHEFFVVYRCKPKVYWDEIHHYGNDVMQKYIKDENGQPGNLINGKINGLFFSARLQANRTLPMCSPFGNVRMTIDADVLLEPERRNFYFADFYCNKSIHYVTVVICVEHSETDRYCRERLIRLNPLSNPFVQLVPPRDRFEKWRFFVNHTVFVELYFTEDVQLNMGQFAAVVATGAGTSRIGGLPNNKWCSVCNLYPKGIAQNLKKPTEKSPENAPNDSTLTTILRENPEVEVEVIETLCKLVDNVEELEMSSEELTRKIDKKLVVAVEEMNRAIAGKNGILAEIARNLNMFAESFAKRRDALIEEVKKLRNE